MKDNIELSIIILCYRSEEAIIDFAKEAQALAASLTDSYEIVLVGNYFENSGDRTKDFVRQLAAEDNHFKAVCKPKEGMMGADVPKSQIETISLSAIVLIQYNASHRAEKSRVIIGTWQV